MLIVSRSQRFKIKQDKILDIQICEIVHTCYIQDMALKNWTKSTEHTHRQDLKWLDKK